MYGWWSNSLRGELCYHRSIWQLCSNSVFVLCRRPVMAEQLSAVGSPSLGWSWVFAIGVLGISCLGIYAGYSEKDLALKIVCTRTPFQTQEGLMRINCLLVLIWCSRWALKPSIDNTKWYLWMLLLFHLQFAGFMGVGMIIMLIFGIIVVVTRNKVIYLSL